MRTAAGAAVIASAALAVAHVDSVRAASRAAAAPAPTATTPTGTTPTATAQVTVSRHMVGRPIPSGFIGLSVEFPAVSYYTGPNPTAINPVFVRLLRNLAPGQAPVVRIGGNSSDATWLPTRGVKPTGGIHNVINRGWLTTVRTLARDTGARLILGLNLKLKSRAEIAAEANAFLNRIGRPYIEALEIGNEPELYTVTPWYLLPDGTPVYARHAGFNFKAYAREVSGYAKALKSTPLAGSATGSFSWLTKLPKLFRAEPNLKIVTYHRYPLIRCSTMPGDPKYPTIPNLLALSSSRGLLQGAAPYIALAHRHGATFRLDELNSVACEGEPGVSDTFASALWALDTLFAVARAGVDGVNIHTLPQAAYQLFTFSDPDGHWLAGVSPEYYALLMFTRAAPPGSRLLRVSATGSPDVRAWAARAPTGQIHIVVINASLTTPYTVAIRPPSTEPRALLETLSAPSATSTGDVTIAGQSFGAETTTGSLTGPVQRIPTTPTGGQYRVTVPAASAAMLTMPRALH